METIEWEEENKTEKALNTTLTRTEAASQSSEAVWHFVSIFHRWQFWVCRCPLIIITHLTISRATKLWLKLKLSNAWNLIGRVGANLRIEYIHLMEEYISRRNWQIHAVVGRIQMEQQHASVILWSSIEFDFFFRVKILVFQWKIMEFISRMHICRIQRKMG